MRFAIMLFALIVAVPMILAPPVSAQEAGLPEDLQRLLEAAAEADNPQAFEDAVELLTLTQSVEAVALGAARISEERGVAARSILGLASPQPADVADAPAPSPPAEASQGAPDAEAAPALRAAPTALARAVASGEPENWSGEARLGVRNDSGNSDRQDYTLGLKAERALALWGFEGELAYAYSEVDGAVGRDEVLARGQIDREAGERWTFYTNAEYRRDALSGFDYTALIGAGAGYRVYARDGLSWRLEAGPAVRIVTPEVGDQSYEPALALGSDFEMAVAPSVTFTSQTSALVAERSRAEQRFSLNTALGSLWALRLSYQYTYEFEPEPGFENADSRTDLEIVREF